MRPLAAALLLVAVAAVVAAAEEIGIYAGEGEASLGEGNRQAARDRAAKEALEKALEAALPDAAPPEELEAKRAEIKKRILADPARYVASFALLSEETRGATLHVSLEARVRLEALRAAVRDIALAPQKKDKKPTLAITPFRARPDGYAFAPEIERPVRARFEVANQPLAPTEATEDLLGAPSFAKARRERNYADFARGAAAKGLQLVALIELTDQTAPDKQADSCDEQAAVQLLDAPAATMLDSFVYQFPAGVSCEKAADAAGKDLFAAIMDSLAKKGRLHDAGATALTVEVLGVGDYDRLQQTLAALRALPYVKKAEMTTFAPGGRVRFAVVYAGEPSHLNDEIAAARPVGFTLKPTGQKGNLWQYSLEVR
jgi:hypothetical protein